MYKKNTDKIQFKPIQSNVIREIETQVTQRCISMAECFALNNPPSDHRAKNLSRSQHLATCKALD